MREFGKKKFTLGCKVSVLLAAVMAAALSLTGCGDGGAKPETPGNSSSGAKGYVFEAGGVKLAVDMDMASVLDSLGEAQSYREEPSCAAQGIAKIYTYGGYEITTYPEGDKDLIACILLKDDTVETPEGVDMSGSREDVIAAYGEGYQEKNESLIYEKDGMRLCFIIQDGNIVSIEYDSSVLN